MKPPDKVPDAVINSIARSHVKFVDPEQVCSIHSAYSYGQYKHDWSQECLCSEVKMAEFERILKELRWNFDHYFFNFAGMYVGVELDGHMHT